MSETIDVTKSTDPIRAALHNAENFDMVKHWSWLLQQPPAIQRTARSHPPNRIYELKGKLVYVFGYGKDGHAIVSGIEDPNQDRVHCDPSELKDVTGEVREAAGLSRYLRKSTKQPDNARVSFGKNRTGDAWTD